MPNRQIEDLELRIEELEATLDNLAIHGAVLRAVVGQVVVDYLKRFGGGHDFLDALENGPLQTRQPTEEGMRTARPDRSAASEDAMADLVAGWRVLLPPRA